MKYYYISESRDWADEFDTFGFHLMNEDEFNEGKKDSEEVIATNPEVEVHFGTNEWHMICGPEDFWGSINVKEISKEEYDTLVKVIGKSGGITTFPLYVERRKIYMTE